MATEPSDLTAPAVELPAPHVIEALRRVMRDMPAIGKDQKGPSAQGGYAYRGIEDITKHAQVLFAKHGVVFVPRVLQETWQREEVIVGGNPWHDELMQVEYDVYGPGGIEDKITVGPIPAIGRDGVDKGANKCMTQAFKYALLQTLCVADKDDDADAHGQTADPQDGKAVPAQREELRLLIREATEAGLAEELFTTDNDGIKLVMGVPVWQPYEDDEGQARLRVLPSVRTMNSLIDALRDRIREHDDPTGLLDRPLPDIEDQRCEHCGAYPGQEHTRECPTQQRPPAPTQPAPASEPAEGPSEAPSPPHAAQEHTAPETEPPAAPENHLPVHHDTEPETMGRRAKFQAVVKAMPLAKVRQALEASKQDDVGAPAIVRDRLVQFYVDQAEAADKFKDELKAKAASAEVPA